MGFYLRQNIIIAPAQAPAPYLTAHKFSDEMAARKIPISMDNNAHRGRIANSVLPCLAPQCCERSSCPFQPRYIMAESINNYVDSVGARSVLEDVQKAINYGLTLADDNTPSDSSNLLDAAQASTSDGSSITSKLVKDELLTDRNQRICASSLLDQQIMRMQADLALTYTRNDTDWACQQFFGYELVPPLQVIEGNEQQGVDVCMVDGDITLSTDKPSTEQQFLMSKELPACPCFHSYFLERSHEAISPGTVGCSLLDPGAEARQPRSNLSAKEANQPNLPIQCNAADDKHVTKSFRNVTAQNVSKFELNPSKRRKLHDITMEQLQQAGLQEMIPQGPNFGIFDKLPITVSCKPPADTSRIVNEKSSSRLSRSCPPSPPRKKESAMIPAQRKPVPTSIEPQSIAARQRRRRISERISILGQLIPGTSKLDTAGMLDQAIKYVQFLQTQLYCLENENLYDTIAGNHPRESASPARMLLNRLVSSEEVQRLLVKESCCLIVDHRSNMPGCVSHSKGSTPPTGHV